MRRSNRQQWTPRYKAVVTVAPVIDLKQLRQDAEDFREAKIEKEIGKGDQLVDGNVAYDHSTHMYGSQRHRKCAKVRSVVELTKGAIHPDNTRFKSLAWNITSWAGSKRTF